MSRIKAVIANMLQQKTVPSTPRGLPQALMRELQHVAAEVSQQTLSVVARHWANAFAGSAESKKQHLRLRGEVEDLKNEVLASAKRLDQAESHRNEKDRALQQMSKEKSELAQSLANLQSALRNAESDFRAAQRTIESFERIRREDRDEIRNLQRRIEDLIGEITLLKSKASGENLNVRSRKPRSS